jgi:hypothetical protein
MSFLGSARTWSLVAHFLCASSDPPLSLIRHPWRIALPIRSGRSSVSSPTGSRPKKSDDPPGGESSTFYGPSRTWSLVAHFLCAPSDPPRGNSPHPGARRSLFGRAIPRVSSPTGSHPQIKNEQPDFVELLVFHLGPVGLGPTPRSLPGCSAPGRLRPLKSHPWLFALQVFAPGPALQVLPGPIHKLKKRPD